MKATTEPSPPDPVAEFQARLSAMAAHQKRACVLMAVRGLMGEVVDEGQPPPPWPGRLNRLFSQFIRHAVHVRARKSTFVGDPAAEEGAMPVIDVPYRVLDEE